MDPTRFELLTDRCRIVVHNADCVAGMGAHVEPGSVDVVVTSPPYNLGIDHIWVVDEDTYVTLGELMIDYLRHLNDHLQQINKCIDSTTA